MRYEKTNAWTAIDIPGYRNKAYGVVFDKNLVPDNGMPIGGLGTGCMDIETRGVYGLNNLFNPLSWANDMQNFPIARSINHMEPLLGISVGGKTWVLADELFIKGGKAVLSADRVGESPSTISRHYIEPGRAEEVVYIPRIPGVEAADDIKYFGHYPMADIEFVTSCPVATSMRFWSPFIPGDALRSNIPGSIFEVTLRNTAQEPQKGTLAFNFPGPSPSEASSAEFLRTDIRENFAGTMVTTPNGKVQYILAVLGNENSRFGGGLSPDVRNWPKCKGWRDIADELPGVSLFHDGTMWKSRDAATSAAVDFELQAGEEKTVRFMLAWYAPELIGGTRLRFTEEDKLNPNLAINKLEWHGSDYDGDKHVFTHMYAARYGSVLDVARYLDKSREKLLKRVIAWQDEIYGDKTVPDWMKDSLINTLYMFPECTYWLMPRHPIGDWAFPTGMFVLNESPRSCPHFSCTPCDWYGQFPYAYFFPELAEVNLKAFEAYVLDDGEAPFSLGSIAQFPDAAQPEYHWQVSLNGFCYIDMVYRLWRITGNDGILHYHYQTIKRCNDFTMNLRTGYGTVIGMPDEGGMEWFEHGKWAGMAAHLGGLRLAELKTVERMAEAMGDKEYIEKCREWFKEGSGYMENDMWTGSYYLNFYDKETGEISDDIMAYQLDGESVARWNNLGHVFDPERIKTVLETVKQTNIKIAQKCGAVNFARPDGKLLAGKEGIVTEDLALDEKPVSFYGIYTLFTAEAMILAMNYMYENQREFGEKLLKGVIEANWVEQGYMWNQPNMVRGDTGERVWGTDYYQNWMLWGVPLALNGQTVDDVRKPDSLVNRVLRAGNCND